jgi:hypothetical protein
VNVNVWFLAILKLPGAGFTLIIFILDGEGGTGIKIGSPHMPVPHGIRPQPEVGIYIFSY